MVEIRAAEGGDDAKLLVSDLFQVYVKYCKLKKYEIELTYSAEASGGFSILEFIINGENAYENFINEAGGHRFQRVPPTEKRGRRQTSTVTVAVLPINSNLFKIKESDLKWETKRGSGAGGQHRNVTESAVKVTHIPTGITAECQNERSQFRNKKSALEILTARLISMEEEKKQNKINNKRKNQIGKGARGDKIRTYRFQDDIVINHITNKKINLAKILAGNLDLLRG